MAETVIKIGDTVYKAGSFCNETMAITVEEDNIESIKKNLNSIYYVDKEIAVAKERKSCAGYFDWLNESL